VNVDNVEEGGKPQENKDAEEGAENK